MNINNSYSSNLGNSINPPRKYLISNINADGTLVVTVTNYVSDGAGGWLLDTSGYYETQIFNSIDFQNQIINTGTQLS